MLSDIVEGVLEFLFHIFIEVICFYTGEIILCFLTFGKKKPRWDYYAKDTPFKFVLMTEISWWLGFFFWVFTIGFIARTLIK